jgi:hypothetical protein
MKLVAGQAPWLQILAEPCEYHPGCLAATATNSLCDGHQSVKVCSININKP